MLEVQGITQRFGGVTALEDVSFRVADGAITGIIGPNGAGKTTLFNIVTGIYTPTCGTVHLQGKNVTRFTPERLASLGMVRTFQNIELFGRMTVLENVMVGLHTKGKSGIIASSLRLPWQVAEERRFRERALHWLEFTGITDLADHEAGSLPFGKGRLLEIARAMALEPKVILMDEPAAGSTAGKPLSWRVSSRKSGNRVSPLPLWSMTWNSSWTSATPSWFSIWGASWPKGRRGKFRKIRK